jgi:DNA ligase 1
VCVLISSSNDITQFSYFVDLSEKILATSSTKIKVNIISEYLSSLSDESLSIAVLFFSNRIFPRGSKFTLNVGFSIIMQVLSEIASLDPNQIQQIYLRHGDMGALSEYAVSKKHMASLFEQQALTLSSIHDRLERIADAIGSGSGKEKKNILKGLLTNSSPLEARYLIKIMNGEMRIGLTESLVEIGVSKAFNQELKDVREAMLVLGDISQVALLAKRNLLSTAVIKPLIPISYMLADVMFTAEEIINYYQKPLICEYKYDGIRAQMHKFGQQVRLFSRKLADVTNSFPELVNAARLTRSFPLQDIDFILDGEVLAFQNGKPLHFQQLQKRLRRKNITEQIMTDIPLVYVVFDIMYFNKEHTFKKSTRERKEMLSNISFEEPIIKSDYMVVDSEEKIITMYEKSREIGHEGLVLKDLDSQYQPGKRGRHWIKLKKELDTIDAVILIAEYGHGKRAGLLSDYTFAVKADSNSDQLRTIGKAYSGLNDDEIDEMTKNLRSMMIKDEGYRIMVKPHIVLEIAFDSIQKSDRHHSGFALRFPRIKNIRRDKDVADIDTFQKVKQIYENQRYLMNKKGQ